MCRPHDPDNASLHNVAIAERCPAVSPSSPNVERAPVALSRSLEMVVGSIVLVADVDEARPVLRVSMTSRPIPEPPSKGPKIGRQPYQ